MIVTHRIKKKVYYETVHFLFFVLSWWKMSFFFLVLFHASLCRFMKPAPMFLDRNFKRLAKVSSYLPPFGFKTQGKKVYFHHFRSASDNHYVFLMCIRAVLYIKVCLYRFWGVLLHMWISSVKAFDPWTLNDTGGNFLKFFAVALSKNYKHTYWNYWSYPFKTGFHNKQRYLHVDSVWELDIGCEGTSHYLRLLNCLMELVSSSDLCFQ